MTRVAVELARRGITANAISPSLVDTPMARAAERRASSRESTSSRRWSRSAGPPRLDIAAACSFLCFEGDSYVTAQVLGVNGGMYI